MGQQQQGAPHHPLQPAAPMAQYSLPHALVPKPAAEYGAPAPPPPPPPPEQPQLNAAALEGLTARLAALEAAVTKLSKAQPAARFCYGQVALASVPVFPDKPAEGVALPAAQQCASKGRWLQLATPFERVRYLEGGAAKEAVWAQVLFVDPHTAATRTLWVPTTSADGSRCFRRFSTFAIPELPGLAEAAPPQPAAPATPGLF